MTECPMQKNHQIHEVSDGIARKTPIYKSLQRTKGNSDMAFKPFIPLYFVLSSVVHKHFLLPVAYLY